MRISIRTRKRRFLFLSGDDVDVNDQATYVALTSADLSPAPEPEEWVYPEEEEEYAGGFGFGVT